jgi:hypothetical protein
MKNIRYDFIMRYDREAVISLYKYYTQPEGLWGREVKRTGTPLGVMVR